MAVRVFVNGVDSYTGKVISEVIANLSADFYPEERKDQAATFQLVGTLLDPAAKKPKWVHHLVDNKDMEKLKAELLQCSHVVYDITQDLSQLEETVWALQELETAQEDFAAPKTFVCVSTIMTWAKTKPNEGDDPSTPITEDEYRRRRPHMNFKAHVEVEKAVSKAGKKDNTKLQTFVVASGLNYGEGEQLFHRFFRAAWELSPPQLECYGDGDNVLPCLHVRDLGAVVASVLLVVPLTRYIIAVDEAQHTLEEILRGISETLGTRGVKKVPKEDALTKGDLTQAEYDSLLISLRVDAPTVRDLPITWHCQTGLLEGLGNVIAEYKKIRNLTPLKIAVFGPPGSGKSHLAKQLSAHYKLPHMHVQEIIASYLASLQAAVAVLEKPDVSPEETEKAESAKDELSEAKINLESNGGRYSDEVLVKWTREVLARGPCRNQGFVLDGFPKTTQQATDIFGGAEERNTAIMPEFIFALDATDDFLKERIMSLPESEVAGTHNTEEGLLRRLARYRSENTEDTTVLNYFDLQEIHPVYIVAENSSAPFDKATQTVGQPHNYGLSPKEKAALASAEAEKKAQQAAKAHEEHAKLEQALAAEQAKAQAAWAATRGEVQKQLAEERDQAALPLRAFLVKHVLPTLTKGLMEVCDVRPEDPIDYLAEYLFKNNPRID